MVSFRSPSLSLIMARSAKVSLLKTTSGPNDFISTWGIVLNLSLLQAKRAVTAINKTAIFFILQVIKITRCVWKYLKLIPLSSRYLTFITKMTSLQLPLKYINFNFLLTPFTSRIARPQAEHLMTFRIYMTFLFFLWVFLRLTVSQPHHL